jgi:hypothetical protein
VGDDEIDGYRVSTVFLGTDHSFTGHGPPVLWETMIFDAGDLALDVFQWRYTSRADAEIGHAKACELLRQRVKAISA